jgi:hypothetical protein
MSGTCCARHLPSFETRRWSERAAGLLFTLAVVMSFALAQAQDQATVVRVEEDWQLVVGQPDATSTAPQVTCVISPQGDLGGLYASIELNHQTQPEFSPGGVHLQTWNGEQYLATRNSPRQGRLDESGETVTWTQSMDLGTEGGLRFSVEGDSTTWGHFGGPEQMRISQTTSLSSLNAYQPSVSVGNSGVGFAANRVTRLVLKEVRYYSAQGLLSRDTTERVVYPK